MITHNKEEEHMAEFRISMNIDNKAFDEDAGAEVHRILERLIRDMSGKFVIGSDYGLLDNDGQWVGQCVIEGM